MSAEAFLIVRDVGKRFRSCTALEGINLVLEQGRTLGIVGPSGSGKSTLARCMALIEPPDCGSIVVDGCDLWAAPPRARRNLRAQVQLIFQEPAASLNPRFTAGEIVAEPLRIQGRPTNAVAELLEMVGLPRDSAARRALDFSGGERQRLAIGRALALEPKLLILDESFAGLDFGVQAQLIELLRALQERRRLTLIVISHDLNTVSRLADEIAVIDRGRMVEHGPRIGMLTAPRHAVTGRLLEASRAVSLEGTLS